MAGLRSTRPTTQVVLLGAYGTGTNWFRSTLLKSGIGLYDHAGTDPGTKGLIRHFFKHYVIESDTLALLRPPDDVLFVCLVKSPLFWISSISRMLDARIVQGPMKRMAGLPLPELIRAPAVMVSARREHDGSGAFVRAGTLPDLWNRYVRGYLENLPEERTLIVRYESAVREPAATFQTVIDRVGGDREALVIHGDRRMGTGHDLRGARSYYADDRNRTQPFSDTDVEFVDARIDHDLLTAIGYLDDGSLPDMKQPAAPFDATSMI